MSRNTWAAGMSSTFSAPAGWGKGAKGRGGKGAGKGKGAGPPSRALMALSVEASSAAHTSIQTLTRQISDTDDQAFEEQMLEIRAAGGVADEASGVAESELEALLGQLAQEPDNDDERAAKFAMYETFAESVGVIRQALHAFWQESAKEFAGSAKHKIEREIAAIDSEQNMSLGYDFGGGRWFVYDMARQANRNTLLIERLLETIKSRLELLAQQDDCPVCLEPIHLASMDSDSEAVEVKVLSCCHKVCAPCWEKWTRVAGGGAFCPLCKNREFLGVIMHS